MEHARNTGRGKNKWHDKEGERVDGMEDKRGKRGKLVSFIKGIKV